MWIFGRPGQQWNGSSLKWFSVNRWRQAKKTNGRSLKISRHLFQICTVPPWNEIWGKTETGLSFDAQKFDRDTCWKVNIPLSLISSWGHGDGFLWQRPWLLALPRHAGLQLVDPLLPEGEDPGGPRASPSCHWMGRTDGRQAVICVFLIWTIYEEYSLKYYSLLVFVY